MRTDRIAILGVALGLTFAAPVAGQSLRELASTCAAQTEDVFLCAPTATSVLAFGEALSRVQTRGTHLPGSSSTLGRRFGTTPRVALSGGMAFTRARTAYTGSVDGTVPSNLVSFDATLAVGLTEGFSPQPTIGGVLAVDLLARVGTTRVYDDVSEGSPTYWGYGLRLGLLRESFTLPGVTLSAMRVHSAGSDRVLWAFGNERGGARTGGSTRIDDVVTTSLRAVAGKEFLSLGLSAGVGWDRTEVDGDFRVTSTLPTAGPIAVEDLSHDRLTLFGGVSRTFLIATISLEGGWSEGLDLPDTLDFAGDVSDFDLDEWDPTGGSFWVSFGTRITF